VVDHFHTTLDLRREFSAKIRLNIEVNFSKTSFSGGTFYTPHSSAVSRDTFHSSLASSSNPNIVHGSNGHFAVYTSSQPMYINSNTYYFGYHPYYYHTTYVHTSSSSSGRRTCAAPLDKYIQNQVPLDTSVSGNSTDDDGFGNNSTSLYDIIKNDTVITTTVLPSSTTTTALPGSTTTNYGSTTSTPSILQVNI
jgi:hypothetical protein